MVKPMAVQTSSHNLQKAACHRRDGNASGAAAANSGSFKTSRD
eukprot:CAMPEP_0204578310 /NCGR_PEP_ID=MMETSP0661-20131031/42851_1 /ASSEMBLY_ACC=CAM_ASM_000606 /TAXON_ID=109239 /ORGANISM="Alexandrium margalefi, Strain AMGDE01CS-322" /LENGTH=42 /DNA_ID= /DNA_START= /DNA_END= /DNA_ORIENTATION=